MGSAMTMPQGIKSLTPDDLADYLHGAENETMEVANQVNKRLSHTSTRDRATISTGPRRR